MEEKELLKRIEIAARDGRTELDLSDKGIKSLPAEIGRLTNLKRLYLSKNQMTNVPKELGQLTNLDVLSLSKNQLRSVPKEIGQLTNLDVLYLERNQLTSVTKELGQLTNLQELFLYNNQLKSVPKELGRLTNLKWFNLSENQLTSVPKELGQLTNLKWLNLAGNKLTSVPKELGQLTNLTTLSLHRNQLTSVPKELGQLKNLTVLWLEGNQITSVPKELCKLKNLTALDLNGNKLTSVPKELGQLTNLTALYLNGNKLTSIPKEVGQLKNLTWIDLSGNQIKSLQKDIVDWGKEVRWEREPLKSGIFLEGNPIESPPIEIVMQGTKAVRNYFKSTEKEDVSRVYEAKLLIVGKGGVGKTCLMKRLIAPDKNIDKNELTTEGIEINQWMIETQRAKDFRVNFWDFGGQEIYHATHQFFLTKRSLYLFVWAARTDDDLTSFDYWLNVVKMLSDNSPVIVVLNKIDERIKPIDEQSVQNKFENVKVFDRVSAQEGTGIEVLTGDIKQQIGQLPHIGDVLPTAWVDIRKRLEGLDKNFISFDEYKEICREFGLDEERAEFLSQYYHDLGVFLHFLDNPVLREIVFLKPDWATSAVYKVVDTKEIQKSDGKFHFEQLKDIWRSYPEDKFAHLLELMKKFELCFQIPTTQTYIVPELLRPGKPELEWDYADNLRFEYRYEFMPAGIITRFIVRTHDICKEEIYWKNGVILNREKTEALIVSDRLHRNIRIWISGEKRKELLAIIRREIDYIHKTLNYPDVKEMIPCVCPKCKGSVAPYYYRLESLRRRLRDGQRMIQCDESYENMNIHEILGDVVIYEKDESGKRIIFVEKYFEKGNEMKIEKINISESKVVFADNIEKVEFNENLGISEKELEELKATIKTLTEEKKEKLNIHYDEFKNAKTEEDKESIARKIKNFLIENGIAVARSLTVEALKIILMASI